VRKLTRHSVEFYHTEVGSGDVDQRRDTYRLHIAPNPGQHYHNAQIADYTPETRAFKWQAGVRLTVVARFNTESVHGTAGFGFWNHPFDPKQRGLPRLPRAAWFFYGSPPNHIKLAQDVPGSGFKCATLDATRWQFLALAPFALPGFVLMRIPPLYRRLWPIGQQAVGVTEAPLPARLLPETHTYRIDWTTRGITFYLDDTELLRSPFHIGGAMGFIAWVDNQYAVVTPQGNFGWGLVNVPGPQTLYIDHLSLEPL